MQRHVTRHRSRSCPALQLTMCVTVTLAACGSGADAADRSGSGNAASRALAEALTSVPEQVSATVETEPVPHAGDAADDPAVWVNVHDPAMSAVVATDKQGGLLVYDLAGRQLQYQPVGEVNNVDVRADTGGGESFTVAGRPVSLVVAGNRSTNTIDVLELDPDTRQLRELAVGVIEPGVEVYGSCLYRSAATGAFFVFVTSKEGNVEQWRLVEDGSSGVAGELVRSLEVPSQVEGCVADDELGQLYIGEETAGIWKFGAEPGAGATGTMIATTSPSGPLVGDVEGLTIARQSDGQGYLVASSQGSNSYVVYARDGQNAFVGTFRIRPGGEIDGAEDTDGIDVSTANLGSAFPSGVFVAQDGKNEGGAQNFKLVPYELIFP